MIRRATLYARLKEPENKYPRVRVEFDRKSGRPIVKGVVTNFYLRIAGKYLDVGADLAYAVSQMRTEQAKLADGVRREEVDRVIWPAPTTASAEPGRTRLVDATEEYKREIKTVDKGKNTILVYSNALDGFVASCHKTFVDEIDRKDILRYIEWMKTHLQVRVPGGQNRTIRNRLTYLGVFLNRHGVQLKKEGQRQGATDPGLLYRSDIPKVVKKKPKKYDQPMIDQLLDHADEDEKDYLLFLLWSGFRDEEVQFLQYSDFHWRNSTVMVQTKPHFDWKPKDCEERQITLPSEISKRMKARMDRPQQYKDGFRKPTDDDLMFPNSDGNPDYHLIKRLHAVAEKAGLNLKGKRAGHMFRKTAGSRVAKKLGLRAAMDFLGHSDIETTALYLAADDADSKKSKQAFEEMFVEGD